MQLQKRSSFRFTRAAWARFHVDCLRTDCARPLGHLGSRLECDYGSDCAGKPRHSCGLAVAQGTSATRERRREPHRRCTEEPWCAERVMWSRPCVVGRGRYGPECGHVFAAEDSIWRTADPSNQLLLSCTCFAADPVREKHEDSLHISLSRATLRHIVRFPDGSDSFP